MLNFSPMALRRSARMAIALIVALGLGACGDLAASLPPRPSPYPTLARLPSVTPVTPSPTPPPSATLVPSTTPTPALPSALVSFDANMRSGPGLDFDVVAVVSAGSSIALRGRQGDWYAVRSADGSVGWMSEQVIQIEPSVADRLPQTPP